MHAVETHSLLKWCIFLYSTFLDSLDYLSEVCVVTLLFMFQALEHLKPSDNCLVGKAPENRDKNRYRDILPCKRTSYVKFFFFFFHLFKL